ncbi:MAG TPA: hypothetical protein VKS79_13145 [Gemmataceae bacterium]|nr:hypothetical protein [Gemmataceae bacterium]
MRKLTLSLFVLLLAAGVGSAQYPYSPYGGPGFGGGNGYGGYGGLLNGYGAYNYGGYSGMSRPPLSPYLNMLSGTGTNAGVNYYNFVRPYTVGAGRGPAGMGNFGGYNALRGQYFPTLNQLDEDFPTQVPELSKKIETDKETLIPVQMSPTGHQAGFANTLGYFGPMMAAQGGMGSRGQGTMPQQQRR